VDIREPRFAPPSWARNPFPVEAGSGAGTVRLNDRYAVREAIRHAYRGGVYRAVDQLTGESVVIKQGRAHVGADQDGHDVRDRLRHEANVLDALSPTGWAPRAVDLFEQGGDLFLVQQDLGGRKLRTWLSDGMTGALVVRGRSETQAMLVQIAAMLRDLQQGGAVIRDFTPNNILITESDRPVLVDLECAALPGDTVDLTPSSGTVGFAPAEQLDGRPAHPSMDSYALGATILFCFVGESLDLSRHASVRDWLGVGIRQQLCPPEFADLAADLCATAPHARPTVAQAARRLAELQPAAETTAPPADALVRAALDDVEPITDQVADDAIDQLLGRLLGELDPTGERLCPPSNYGESMLPTSVQHGAAGVLGVLVQAATALEDPALLSTVGDAARWVERAVADGPSAGPVGLYFGLAGPCWALADAGRALGDQAMIARAVDRALTLPTDWSGPDVTHGLAGLGLTLVQLLHVSGDERLIGAIDSVSDTLLRRAEHDEHGISWRTPDTAPSVFAGQRYLGFAHGTAGIGRFLLDAAHVTGNADAEKAAADVCRTLLDAAQISSECATWASEPGESGPLLPNWCHGSAGVATFFLDAGRRLPGFDLVEPLDRAARAMLAAKWHSGTAYCHGLAGNADVLLDISDAQPGDYRRWAADLLRVMWAARTTDPQGPGLGDSRDRITADFNIGYGGGLSTLLRLRHGGPRRWLPEIDETR
jgi:tRNA A-37 threonylcarbamoyl transferase component Bud32